VNLVALEILLFLWIRVGVVTATPTGGDGSRSTLEIGPATSSGSGMRTGLLLAFEARDGLLEAGSE
jgi:hypothetical protein